jgi:hypothetical protein
MWEEGKKECCGLWVCGRVCCRREGERRARRLEKGGRALAQRRASPQPAFTSKILRPVVTRQLLHTPAHIMPPRLNVLSIARQIPYRPRPQCQWRVPPAIRPLPSQCRAFADQKAPPPQAADRSKRPDAEPLPHVSEEAAKIAEIQGQEGPDLSQGTPVEEVGCVSAHRKKLSRLTLYRFSKGTKQHRSICPK